jgi:hypothetical protein
VPGARIELATPAFSGRRSTNELPRLFNNLQSANVGCCYCGANRNPASELSREFFAELSVLMASPNHLRFKNYNGSIAPSQLADAPVRDGDSAWSWNIFLGVQGILYRGEGVKPTLAVSYSHKLYDGGAPEFDYGSPTNSLLVLASADVKGFHYDANIFFTELNQGPIRRGQFGQSLTISRPFLRRFTLSGEIWHFTQPFSQSNAVGNLWSVSYSARNNLGF